MLRAEAYRVGVKPVRAVGDPCRRGTRRPPTLVVGPAGQYRHGRRPRSLVIRRAAAMIGTALGVMLGLAACGGGPSGPGVASEGSTTTEEASASSSVSSSSSSSSSSEQSLAFSHCMRSHGVPSYPDPGSDGNLPKANARAFGVGLAQFRAAQQACRSLLPTNFTASLTQCLMTGDCPPAVVQEALTQGLQFARCMRSHGVPNWPDPTVDSTGRPSFQVTAAGISIASTRSARMLSKIGHCQNQPGAALLRQE